ncbi:MAG: nucleotidyl transferase AbiEii/AbiGii toxin family protein [Phycisphaerae bacterium]
MTPSSGLSWERVERAVEKVRERLRRAANALEAAGVRYAVAGGNAVAVWVARVDEAATRTTQDVDLLLQRCDLESAKAALAETGFVFRHVKGIDMFLDGPAARARDAVHLVFAGEKVRASDEIAAPQVDESEPAAGFRVLALGALVRMKLTAYRDKDRVHLRDLLDVGLIDESWYARLPTVLASRLRQLVETPES